MVSWPLLERAGEEREEDLDGKISPGLGVLSVRVLESKPGTKKREEKTELLSEVNSECGANCTASVKGKLLPQCLILFICDGQDIPEIILQCESVKQVLLDFP